MSNEPNTIRINDFAGFQASVNKLEGLRGQIEEKIKAGDAVLKTITAAASKGTVPSAGTAAESSGTTVAPAYTETVSAISTAVSAVTTQANAAGSSLTTAITDLGKIRSTQQAIQESGANKVQK
ncbi:Uncharacterised protein (plasmid) [Tsukamurella tyrosinosolvens]|uniref:Excreted virulence factor EspC, type VII ESX diderm n=1 Tax=Tsukamurella tyrosinosolvens TaxID=57704 RepID=A0A1H4VGU8_TSUTY|nr:hypothetical protein [Tsukamurella tyrosinosolvens]KXO90983.1 hypothetical protein AXK58_21365 [Tsukamurella tyrosinosolvens]SEC80100.1 hypothetical protein SAMN04489793_3221 [Tsukamurella tyrosinosolvens]VEH90532.1 Uncharacterised protein [Tsukamurella tyrosinosolvens]